MARAASYVVSGTLDFPNRLLRFPVETQRRGGDAIDVKPVSPRYFFALLRGEFPFCVKSSLPHNVAVK